MKMNRMKSTEQRWRFGFHLGCRLTCVPDGTLRLRQAVIHQPPSRLGDISPARLAMGRRFADRRGAIGASKRHSGTASRLPLGKPPSTQNRLCAPPFRLESRLVGRVPALASPPADHTLCLEHFCKTTVPSEPPLTRQDQFHPKPDRLASRQGTILRADSFDRDMEFR